MAISTYLPTGWIPEPSNWDVGRACISHPTGWSDSDGTHGPRPLRSSCRDVNGSFVETDCPAIHRVIYRFGLRDGTGGMSPTSQGPFDTHQSNLSVPERQKVLDASTAEVSGGPRPPEVLR